MSKNRKIFFSSPGFDIGGTQANFLEGVEIGYVSIFLWYWSDNFKLVKKIKKNIEKSKIIFFGCGIGYYWDVDPFSKRP